MSAGSAAEEALLAELDRATNLRAIQPKMISGRVQGRFLRIIAGMLQPQTVLEIGTFTGYSALSIAAGLAEGARLHTVEIDDELEEFACSFFARSPHGSKIHMHTGPALEVVPGLAKRLGRPFDMVFIDGDKRQYPDYLRMLMGDFGFSDGRDAENCGGAGNCGGAEDGVDAEGGEPADAENIRRRGLENLAQRVAKAPAPSMVRSGSVILADNVLWYGKVTDPGAIKAADRMSQGIIEFNRIVAADPRLENVILPLRDGINMIRVK